MLCAKSASNGYTLFGAGSRTWLLDMEGRVVHTWPLGTNPHLLDNGNILDASKDDPSGFHGFKEVDWDGKTAKGIDTYQKRRPPGARPQRKGEGRPARNDHS